MGPELGVINGAYQPGTPTGPVLDVVNGTLPSADPYRTRAGRDKRGLPTGDPYGARAGRGKRDATNWESYRAVLDDINGAYPPRSSGSALLVDRYGVVCPAPQRGAPMK